MKRVFGKIFLASALTIFAAGSLAAPSLANAASNSENKSAIAKLESIKSCYLASIRQEALQTKNAVPESISTGPAAGWLSNVAASRVNMVTNKVEKTAQKAVSLNGKTYFAGENYASTMIQNQSLRFAADPLTNKKIDKADAVIFADASGRVFYFESENSYKDFISLANPETVYGYSEAK